MGIDDVRSEWRGTRWRLMMWVVSGAVRDGD